MSQNVNTNHFVESDTLQNLYNPQDLSEWRKSGVSDNIIALNVTSLSGTEPHDRLFYALTNSERRNDGRLRDRWLRRYDHCSEGGFWVSGVDVLTGEEAQWGQFKPKRAYRTLDKSKGFGPGAKEKIIKYEAPPKAATEIFACQVDLATWQAIGEQCGVELPENIKITEDGRAFGFWQWIIDHPEIPLLITEGAKKAGALLTEKYVAIALPGIFNGYRQEKDESGKKVGEPYLIPQLQVFAAEGREVVFCFDNDIKPKTVLNVRKAISKTGGLFAKEGCKVSVIVWQHPFKGVDDLIVARGVDCFREAYKARIPLSKLNLIGLFDLSKYSPKRVNMRYLGEELVAPEDAQIIGLKSGKGTNKTGWMVDRVQRELRKGKPVIVVVHRIQLAKTLCDRFGIDHIEEVRSSETKGILGYGVCIDSLHPNSRAQFDPLDWAEATVILDECEQVIWHLLDSGTCQSNRVAIIDNFQKLLKTVISGSGKIYLADADLSCISLDYIHKLIGIPVKTWVVENAYNRKSKRKLFTYSGNDPRELVRALMNRALEGEKILLHTSAQQKKSAWGSINLELSLKSKFPELKILRIDRESVADPQHKAYGCISNLDDLLANYDIVIASPVIETGVSIDLKEHFDSVWCIAQGVQTVDAVCQAIERLRDDVPRHIWIKKTAKGNRIGNGTTSIKRLLASQHKLTTANIRLLQQAGIEEFDSLDVDFSPDSLTNWAKRACLVNLGKNNYREEVISKLLLEGYELADFDDGVSIENYDEVKELVEDTKEQNYQEYCQAVPKSKDVADAELEELNNKKAKTESQRLAQRKGNLARRYGTEVTAELVKKDDNGWYGKLQLHYYLTIGNIYLAEKDRRSLNKFKHEEKAFKPDINKKQMSAKVKTLQLIGIEQFLDPEAEFDKDSLAEWFAEIIRLRFDIKTLLGVSINPEEDSAIAVAQRLLRKIGQNLTFDRQVRSDGKRLRIYRGCSQYPDGSRDVFDYWLKRDRESLSSDGTPFSKEYLHGEGEAVA